MNYGALKFCDIANGPGMRTSIFVSGCSHHCHGCFNKVTWDYNYGKPYDNQVLADIINSLWEPNIQGLSVLGGEPLDPKNQADVASMVMYAKLFTDEDKDIWLYTGYLWETIPKGPDTDYILNNVDVIVDGPFIESLKDISLKFRGSSNQRIIDVKETLKKGEVVLLEDY